MGASRCLLQPDLYFSLSLAFEDCCVVPGEFCVVAAHNHETGLFGVHCGQERTGKSKSREEQRGPEWVGKGMHLI